MENKITLNEIITKEEINRIIKEEINRIIKDEISELVKSKKITKKEGLYLIEKLIQQWQ